VSTPFNLRTHCPLAATPFTVTRSLEALVLKPWPWIVTVPPVTASWGVKPKIASLPGGTLDRLICVMLPTAS